MTTLTTLAMGLGVAGFLLSLAPLVARSSSPSPDALVQSDQEPVVITPAPVKHQRPSLRMTHKQLLKLARERKCGTAKFRAHARKVDLVRALQAQEGNK